MLSGSWATTPATAAARATVAAAAVHAAVRAIVLISVLISRRADTTAARVSLLAGDEAQGESGRTG